MIREKRHISFKEGIVRIVAKFSTEIMEASKYCNIFKILKENTYQTKITYTVKTYFKSEGEINTFNLKNYWEKLSVDQYYNEN